MKNALDVSQQLANPQPGLPPIHPTEIGFTSLLLGMGIAAILSYALGLYYVRYGKSISNRALLAKDFVLLTLTTTLVITIVKSSLALSLGLVGALSIVRFRAAIKEPEELTFLFLAISIGLGCGADQWKATIAAFVLILFFVHLKTFRGKNEADRNLFVNVELEEKNHPDLLEKVMNILRTHSELVDMRRVDSRAKSLHSSYLIYLKQGESMQRIINDIQQLQPTATVTFIDQTRRADI
jgi:uncharacterized membrane protein YhiD involved in acid resistance